MSKVIFFGNERLATGVTTETPVLRGLIGTGYEVCAVVASHHKATSRRDRELEVEATAREHHIPLLLPDKLSDIREELSRYQADIGVLVAYGKIVPQSIIDLFPHGIINLHPSLLPRHRGPIPIEAVILEGATETGVSIMQLASAMDAGPIYAQKVLALDGSETKQGLSDSLLQLGSQALLTLLPDILSGEVHAVPQNEALATVDHRIAKSDGQIDWAKPATTLEREVRAYLGWPGSKTTLYNREVTLTAAHVVQSAATDPPRLLEPAGTPQRTSDGELAVLCGDGSLLVIDALTPAGRRQMTGREILAGHQAR